MVNKNNPEVRLYRSEKDVRRGDLRQLITHFRDVLKLELQGDDLDWLVGLFQNSRVVANSRFEIILPNDTVVMETLRRDRKITRCYLVRGIDDPKRIHLQVNSRIKKRDIYQRNAEVDGIFPFRITGIRESGSSDGDLLTFCALGTHGGVTITEDGRVEFHQMNNEEHKTLHRLHL
ncbi:hypothetical protein M1403_02785 [Patescibacteria group bacterium]|nr:hypothetical protein [Patescibacteria group bacterium]